MKLRSAAILLVLATCTQGAPPNESTAVRSAASRLGKIAPSEVAVWKKTGASNSPDGRYLQATTFDEARKVVVVFGGIVTEPSEGPVRSSQETWEWSPATGKWTNRTLDGKKPDARAGAAMAYDAGRAKVILFGGRGATGLGLDDTWEWDPATGAWTDVTGTGAHPSARSQHALVFEKSTGKVLLFGGGRTDPNSFDGSGVSMSLGDTWEYDPAAKTWAERSVASAPSVRNDSALVWDSARNKAILFGGIQIDIAGALGAPKQDTWEWDPATATWTERTTAALRPTPRYSHAMAFDGTRKKVVLFGGWDMNAGLPKTDLWEWEPTTGAWTQRLIGSEVGIPSGRMYASMVSDDARARMLMVAGAVRGAGGGGGTGGSAMTNPHAAVLADMMFASLPSREVWELDPTTPAFTDRTPALDAPTARFSQATAFNPSTGKTSIFGGSDAYSGKVLGDYWEWDGAAWAQPKMDALPGSRTGAAMAFDPARNSLIVFGGVADLGPSAGLSETWELTSAGKWARLATVGSPAGLVSAGMVTDTARKKILLFGGAIYPQAIDRNQVWEWDGASMSWTDRTPPDVGNGPRPQRFPSMAYDEGRRRLVVYEGQRFGGSESAFFDWDPVSTGWTKWDTNEKLGAAIGNYIVYDPIRRRVVIFASPYPQSGADAMWELDPTGPTWYVRGLSALPTFRYAAGMVFDSRREIAVFFGGQASGYSSANSAETWEYKVTGWGNGEGCTAATAGQCASGFCVDGVCCDVAACTGPCKSCNVPGSEGTCVLAKPGTEVPGSCTAGKACDGTGTCKARNGIDCTAGAECASGNCADGVCCDSACNGFCTSCNQAGRAGQCTPYQAGTDPQHECEQGSGACRSTCDGVGTCGFPTQTTPCGDNCLACDGHGTCSAYDPACGFDPGYGGTAGGGGSPVGGAGGFSIGGNSGGYSSYSGGSSGGYNSYSGGAGGYWFAGGGSQPYAGGGGNRGMGGAGGSPYDVDGGELIIDGGLEALGSDGRAADPGRTDGAVEALGLDGSDGPSSGTGGRDGSIADAAGIDDGGSVIDAGRSDSAGKADAALDAATKSAFAKSGCNCAVGQRSRPIGFGGMLVGASLAAGLLRRRRAGRR